MALTAFVTGAAGGIGRAVAQRLAADGFSIIATDMDAGRAREVAASLTGTGHVGLALDVSSEEAVIACLREVETDIAPVNVLVAAAGILILDETGQRRPLTETSFEEWDKTQTINSTGTFLLLREYLRHRTRTPLGHARFVGFSSVAAQLGGYRSSSAYIASKSAILGLIKAGAREAASLGVTVNAVAPGLIDAPMLRLSLDPSQDAEISRNIPMGRIGTPDDVAGAVSYLAGPDGAYVTGATLDINGGYRMQ